MMNGSKIFITGGAGYLGTNLIERYHEHNDITVYSRDEAKHYYLKKQYPKVRFIVGDVRNYDLLRRAAKGHDTGIYAASLKQIEACYSNYEEANRIIVEGAFNSRRASEECGFVSACFISSDKSRAATTIYGAMKYVAGESFIADSQGSSTRLTTAIYGNVMNSTGSIIPMIWKSIGLRSTLKLYGTEMTRFMLTINEAMDLIEKSLEFSSCNTIPNVKSFLIRDLFEIYREEFRLSYVVDHPRAGEKLHEIMASNEEVRRMHYDTEKNMYILRPEKETIAAARLTFDGGEYSSKNVAITKEELRQFLQDNNFFDPR